MNKIYLNNEIGNNAALQYIRLMSDSIARTNERIVDLMNTDVNNYIVDREMLIGLCDSLTAVASYQNLIIKHAKLVTRD